MKKLLMVGTCVAALGAATAASAADRIQITTSYGDGYPSATYSLGYTPSPDTGFITFTNVGSTTFVGTLSDVAVSYQGEGDDYSLSGFYTLTAGQSVAFGVAPESSNIGGFNNAGGIVVRVNGLFSDGFNTGSSWSVSDSNIHSGIINAGGITDAYVLQGGNVSGYDYGDGIEDSQAFGRYTFSNVSAVPEPSTWVMMLAGLAGLGFVGYRRNKSVTLAD